MLQVSDLSIGYNGNTICSGINFEPKEGTVTALLGCNGAGKSTLFKTISGELKAITGEVLIAGKEIRKMSNSEKAKVIALVTTDFINAGGLTVRELTSLGRAPHTGFFGRLGSADNEIVEKAMFNAGIAHKSNSFVADLSDGERQKALIARAFAQDSPLLLLDEPFSFLDVASRIEILSLLKKMAAEKNKTIIYSSHDVAQALRMADNLLLFTADRQIISGTPHVLIETGKIKLLFANDDVIFSPTQNDFISAP